jgi:hypothetical protein
MVLFEIKGIRLEEVKNKKSTGPGKGFPGPNSTLEQF